MSERVKVDRRMYLTEDRERAVPDGHPDGRFLLCTPGDEMSRADAMRYGLLAPPEPKPAAESEPEVEAKQAAPPANKARGRAANKSGG